MKQDMVMPQMGESITEGTIIKWLKKVGDTVDKDEIVLEISTDKVDSEIPTPVAGKIVEVLAKENDTVEVGNVIARIETAAGSQPEEKESEPPKESEKPPAPREETEPSVEEKKEDGPPVKKAETAQTERVAEEGAGVPAPPAKQESTKFYSPVVLSIARKEGISSDELENIDGSGISGRVTKQDVLNYLEQRQQGTPSTPAAATTSASVPAQAPAVSGEGVEIIPMDHIRKKIAEHMVLTVHTAAHVGLYIEVDMLNVFKIRERSKDSFNRKEGIKLTYMPFIAEAVVKTLKEFPLVNASLDENNIVIKHFINLGIAVDTEQGLIVPVIKNTDALNIVGIARAINDLADRARNRKLKPDDVSGGTFSISNFGVFGTKIGFPLINQPQVAILGVGSLEKRAVVVNDAIAIRPMMDISLTFDHRLIDGALGARFLQRLKAHLESYETDMQI
jgi:2-oxoglutarate dehydrogenase dihydrolipoamide succinyltransferase (E2 component)